LEFVLAASEGDEAQAWDEVIDHGFLPRWDGAVLERYRKFFSTLPTDLNSEAVKEEISGLSDIAEGLAILGRLRATLKAGPCLVCKEESKTRCGRCRQVFFCGTVHQKSSWPVHKKECKPGAKVESISESEQKALMAFGPEWFKHPQTIPDIEKCESSLKDRQAVILKHLIALSRSKDMVIRLHLLHLGSLTQ